MPRILAFEAMPIRVLERPDAGFAWMVVFCACLINTLLSGMARMIGILYVALIQEYGISRREASLPFILRNAIRYFAGPVVGVLGQAYGVHTVTFWGGLIAAAGSILCALAPTVDWIVFFWGCIHGVGYALAITLLQHVTNQWFERHRATASGLVLAGSCATGVVYPLMLQAMLDGYGVKGCFLLLGGFFLHVLPPALVLRVPPWIQFPDAYARHMELISKSPIPSISKTCQLAENSKRCSTSASWTHPGETQLDGSMSRLPVSNYFDDKKRGKLWFDKEEDVERSERVVCTRYQSLDNNELSYFEWNSQFKGGICNPAFVDDKCAPDTSSKVSVPAGDVLLRTLCRIPRLYLNPVYDLISLSIAVYFWMFLPLMTVVVDYTRDKGIPQDYEKFLIYAVTFGDMFGRLAFGWVTDRKFLSLPSFMMLSFVFEGAVVALLPMSKTPVICMVVLVLAGIPAGTAFVHFPVLIHNYVKEEDHSIAYGCCGLVSSVVSFGISPLIGYFRDEVGCYDGLFYIISVMLVVSGCLWPLVSHFKCCHDPSRERPREYSDVFKDARTTLEKK